MERVIASKVASIQRCIQRAREEYIAAGDNFNTNYTHQDAAVLNVVRACELAIDLAIVQRIIQTGLDDLLLFADQMLILDE